MISLFKFNFITLLFLFIFKSIALPQFITKDNKEIMEKAYEGIEYIYKVKPQKAAEKFKQLITKYPAHPFGHFGLAMSKWAELEYLEEESSPKLYEEYHNLTEKAIEVGKRWVENNPDDANAYMCLGGTYGLGARLYVMQHSWLKAYLSGRKAVKYMKKSLEIDPELYDAYLGLGLWEYSAGTLPGVIKWLAKLITGGDAKKGIDYLKLCAEKGRFNVTASKLLLIEIWTQTDSKYSNPKLAVQWAKELIKKYPNLAQMQFVLIVALYEAKEYDEAEKEMLEYERRISEGMESYYPKFYPRIYVSLGTLYMMRSNYDKALDYFSKARDFIKKEEHPTRWSVWGVARIGNIYDLKGMREKAIEAYKEALGYKDQWGFKEYIEQYLKKPFSLSMYIATQLPPP
ncbi:MAG: tetratricopeptide repeat protein [Elusimicrobiota bacterium]